ncbi:MAG: ABC transporter ATP-binding protein [Planctomycetota bacterium]|jgi:ABC-2 type transport system ATP-binding protein|nr:ABC transporter ATP-binding protein [Planctomycetota bacterium]
MVDPVEVEAVVKRYGTAVALAGVTLRVGRGEIFGLLGQNGAGKTTLVKILLGMVAPTAGTARLLGIPVGTPSARRAVGYLPEDHRLPEYHTAASLLDCYGGLQGLPRSWRRQRAAELIEMIGLGQAHRLKVRNFSKGMKQRLGLAQALLHRPDVLFLDEPTDGVDPIGRKQIRDLLLAERARGVTIFINSHLLGEVEQLCDRVAILRKGKVVRSGSVVELTHRQHTWLVGFDRPVPDSSTWASAHLDPPDRNGISRVHLADEAALDLFLAEATGRGFAIRHLQKERGTLEDLYLQCATVPIGPHVASSVRCG